MSRPIYEPSLQRTDARLGYGSAQLFRRPPRLSTIPFGLVQFEGEFDFVSDSYPDWNWGPADLTSLYTNDDATFVLDGSGAFISILAGFYTAGLHMRYQVDGQFLDLPPQAGTTRTNPGNLGSKIKLEIAGTGADLDFDYYVGEEDYETSAELGALGLFDIHLGGIVGATFDTIAYPTILSKDALIGPNDTGSFPENPPVYSGSMWLARLGTF
jgi:hypothetical protein